ncbi:hypothetical protein OSB04_016968 [Centaurea solstitialis]|uniref:Uncharacterized protein n=1 Tax=Centaurea solstitialis TaxID=347529 RepID=A0AA38TM28_9ASTR|nr:hypothetical protein OSB04_016968 [Centaurea solstitialis]
MDSQKKINESSYLHNQQNWRISQTLIGRTQGELPTQTQVNPKVDASKAVMMVDGITKKKSWTDIYTKKHVPSDSDSATDYATDYVSDLPEGITVTLNDLTLREPIYLDDEDDDYVLGVLGGKDKRLIVGRSDSRHPSLTPSRARSDLFLLVSGFYFWSEQESLSQSSVSTRSESAARLSYVSLHVIDSRQPHQHLETSVADVASSDWVLARLQIDDAKWLDFSDNDDQTQMCFMGLLDDSDSEEETDSDGETPTLIMGSEFTELQKADMNAYMHNLLKKCHLDNLSKECSVRKHHFES